MAILPDARKKFRAKLYDAFLYTKLEKEAALREKHRKLMAKELSDFVHSRITKGTVCIDCGANVGKVSSAWADKGAIIHAFEPHPACFKVLQSNLKDQNNVTLYNQGVGLKNEKLKLYLKCDSNSSDVNESASIIPEKSNVSADNFIIVDVIDLIDFIKNLGVRVGVLKLDIEGAEVALLNEIIDRGIHQEMGLIVAELHENIPGLSSGISMLKDKIRAQDIKNIHLDWE
ncbi:MAG: FkbM family methyltransferase [Coraliomargaritaceae bacterium]